MRTNKTTRLLVLLIAAILLMTCVAYATDLLGLANKGKEYVSQFLSAVCIIAVLFGVAKLVSKQNFPTAVITAVFGFTAVYFIANPDKIQSIIDATIGKMV